MKLSKPFTIIIAIIAIIAGIAVFVTQSNTAMQVVPGTPSTLAPIPAPFTQLSNGLTEKQVLALVGPPKQKTVYAGFVHKTPAEWAKIQSDVDAVSNSTADYNVAPSVALIKEKTELSHRYHDIWYYSPSKQMNVILYFIDDNTLANVVGAPEGKPPSHSPTAPGIKAP